MEGGRSFDRIQSNAGNIGFAASVDTGMDGIKVNLQCEQFTYYNHFAGGTGWCNRNSKIGLSHPMAGEIMFATWLLPYNEGVAQWVDPFYDAGADSHTSIMGSVGANTIFYNTGDFDRQASDSHPTTTLDGAAEAYDTDGGTGSFEGYQEFNYAGLAYDTGFNRRQENIIQYWSPNWNGFVFRFAWTAGIRDETTALGGNEIDPIIRSSSLAYTNGPLWLAVTWQDHEDWTAASISDGSSSVMEGSDAESIRLAGRYIMDMGDGMSVQVSAMYEDLEYEFNGVVDVDTAMAAFGYGGFASSYDLRDASGVIGADPAPARASVDEDTLIKQRKTYALLNKPLSAADTATDDLPTLYSVTAGTGDEATTTYHASNTGLTNPVPITPPAVTGSPDDPFTLEDESAASNYNGDVNIFTMDDAGDPTAEAAALKTYLTAFGAVANDADAETAEGFALKAKYNALVYAATAAAQGEIDSQNADADDAYDEAVEAWGEDGADSMAANRAAATAGQNVKIEREAWMVSGKIKFGGPLDFRFSYMDADDLEVSCASCSGDWDETAADAWNIGLFYTMPAGTELRLTYSEVDNDDNGTYGQGISGTGLGSPGAEIEMFAVGIVHWFD